MATGRQREPSKTWSLLGDVRKKPSEYEVVTAKLHFHYGRQPSPFDLDPTTPINAWYLKYREGSPLQTDDWEGFRDPHQLTYRLYVQRQADREGYLGNLVDEFERHNHDASLQGDWVQVLDRLYLPARFPIHTLQMTALYMAQMAPSSFMTNAAYFQAADELRRIQWTAYRAKSLSSTIMRSWPQAHTPGSAGKRMALGNPYARPWKKCSSPMTGVRLLWRSIWQ